MQNTTADPITKVLDHLEDPTRRNGEFRARCPAHKGESDNSLSIERGDDGRVLLRCFGGCDLEEVLRALQLEAADLFPNNGQNRTAKTAKTTKKATAAAKSMTWEELPAGDYYLFEAPDGEVLYAQRHRGAYYRPVGGGQWKKGLDGVTAVLYNLPEFLDGVRAGRTIFHVEGPKDVETARERLGVVATTSGGVSSWKASYRQHYTGADVVIIPDKDGPGLDYARQVAEDVGQVARSVKILQLPELEPKGDLTDWLEAGHTAEEFFAAVEAAPPYRPELEAWPDPVGLDSELPAVEEFSSEMLPAPLGEHVMDTARRMDNVAPDFIAAPLVVAAAAMIGRKIAIRPKARDDWTMVPNLWGANVGPPSSMKSPAQATALKPLGRLAAVAREEYQQDLKKHKLDLIEDDIRAKTLKADLTKAIKNKNGEEVTLIRGELEEMTEENEPPVETRYTTSDATVEKLGELLRHNPNGLLNDRDELMGWLTSLDRPGHEADRAFFLESWNGDKPFDVDRIGRGSIHVPALCLSIFGGIQPGPLMRYVRDALSESEKADGLLQRFQVLVWPDVRPYARADESPDPVTRDAVNKIFERLASFDAAQFGATMPDDDEAVPFVRFDEQAQTIVDAWRDTFEPEIRDGGYPAAVEAHFLKYRSLFASLALVFEVLTYVAGRDEERACGAVRLEAASKALRWCEYLASHARRLYHPALIADKLAAAALLERIEAGDVPHLTKTRDIWRKGWQDLATADELSRALTMLEAHGWVRRETLKPDGGGRPSEVLALHPSLREE